MSDVDALDERLRAKVGTTYGPYHAWDAVNAAMIRQWCEAISIDGDPGERMPRVAPRAMINVWMMRGVADGRPEDSVADDPYGFAAEIRAAGYIGTIATQCRQDYVRDLRTGERLSSKVTLASVSPLKKTGLGEGWFATLRHDYDVDGEPVGSMAFTTLHYKPAAKAEPRPPKPQPGISDDTRFFWEGLKADKLLAQKCCACGTLRHPPGPVCTHCHSLDWETQGLSGRGTLYSWVVAHHATHPAFDYPHKVGLIALDEGLRIVAPLDGFGDDDLADGAPVEAVFHHQEGQDLLPSFRPRRG